MLQTTKSESGNFGGFKDAYIGAHFGTGGETSNQLYLGLIDEVAIYSRALSLTEVNNLASNPIPEIPEPGTLILGFLAVIFVFKLSCKTK